MKDSNDAIINLKIHQDQFYALYNMLINTLFEGDTKRMVDLLYRTIKVPFRNKGDQLAIVLLDKRRQGVVAAFYIKINPGGNFQLIESIPLTLSDNGDLLSDVFKVRSSEFPQAVERAKSILQATYGNLWTLIVIDFIQISKLYSLLDFEPTKELIGKVAKRLLKTIKDEKIILDPVPEVVNAIERIL